jgi:ParB family chromosome partitioning protein
VFIENLQREQLDVHEEAEAYRQLISADAEGGTTDMVMRRVGKDMKSIQKRVWMLHLPPVVKKAVVSKLITTEHAKLLSQISGEQKQCDLLERIYRDKLSVEDTKRIISGYPASDRIKEPGQEQSAATTSRYSRNTIRRLDGCLFLVRELVSAIRDAGIPMTVTETLDGKTFEINLSFPVKNN